jgi:hypothetical protein
MSKDIYLFQQLFELFILIFFHSKHRNFPFSKSFEGDTARVYKQKQKNIDGYRPAI